MTNKDWYFGCNFSTGEVTEYTQLPVIYGNINGLVYLSDQELEDLSWANLPSFGFVKYNRAVEKGISSTLLNTKLQEFIPAAMDKIRAKRNVLLSATDWTVIPDRFALYSTESQTRIVSYRQALRDMTSNQTDYYNPIWPTIPEELLFLNSLDIE